MPNQFLGKPVPVHQTPRLKRLRRRSYWGSLLLAIPFVIATAAYGLHPQSLPSSTNERAVGPAAQRSFQSIWGTVGIGTAQAASQAPCDFTSLLYNTDGSGNATDIKSIFPFVPDELNDNQGHPTCTQPFWDRTVFVYFILKLLSIFNWFAGAMAIILTVAAGILYILGYIKEDNAKKAKTLLVSTYVGLIIVLLARVLVFGTADLLSNSAAENAFQTPPGIQIPNNQ